MADKIYLADDEKNIRELLEHFLTDAGYEVEVFSTADALFERFLEDEPDLVILDVMMPGTDGFTISQRIRRQSNVPIILLTARDTDADYMTGFTTGADDYFTKPFSPVKLVLRIKAMLGRLSNNYFELQSLSLKYGDLELLEETREIKNLDSKAHLTNTEYDVMKYLLEHKQRAISREELLDKIWGYGSEVETRVTDDTIKRLRRKLRDINSRTVIETVWGYGFSLAIIE